jgi:hypothetical protein
MCLKGIVKIKIPSLSLIFSFYILFYDILVTPIFFSKKKKISPISRKFTNINEVKIVRVHTKSNVRQLIRWRCVQDGLPFLQK